MKFNILLSDNFKTRFKKLAKKYNSLKQEFSNLVTILEEHPETGTAIGKKCFKIRLAVSSKGKGKSGGLRIISYAIIEKSNISTRYL
ncbi:MAG: hypothetical protein ACK5UE_09245 [Chitinophagales bacterium]|jgi:mRNA-degrading endonuclease RelE of RelBE toxin-antitoxin system|nr:hypothetical protein [Sphingobacteriales bacterium]